MTNPSVDAPSDQDCPNVGDPTELPWEKYEAALERAVAKFSGRPSNHARNAIVHLRKAYKLVGVDNEMAAFRAITAEEEAATAVYLAARFRHYPDSEKIQFRNHAHKVSLFYFISSVAKLWVEMRMPTPRLKLSDSDTPSISAEFRAKDWIKSDEIDDNAIILLDNPLHFSISGENNLHDFQGQLLNIATERGCDEIADYVKREANKRNKILYASEHGIPKVSIERRNILNAKSRILITLSVFVAIMQTPELQNFAIQAIRSILKIQGKIDLISDEGMEQAPWDRPAILVDSTNPDKQVVTIGRRLTTQASFLVGFLPVWNTYTISFGMITDALDRSLANA